MRNFFSTDPREFFAPSITMCSPFIASAPVMRPVAGSSFSPLGRFCAEKLIGRSPVAAIVNRNGDPGRTPKTDAPLMRGEVGAGGVRMYGATDGAAIELAASMAINRREREIRFIVV